MIIFNDRVVSSTFEFLASYGIVGLYVSVVFVVGKFVRLMVDRASQRIMFEDLPQVDTLMRLCDAVYLCREMAHLDLEHLLYAELVLVYRSSEGLMAWTDPDLIR